MPAGAGAGHCSRKLFIRCFGYAETSNEQNELQGALLAAAGEKARGNAGNCRLRRPENMRYNALQVAALPPNVRERLCVLKLQEQIFNATINWHFLWNIL
jgi:hypothetical protein